MTIHSQNNYARLACHITAILAVFLLPRGAYAQEYHITNLGVLPNGTFSVANAINDSGLTVGQSDENGPTPYLRSVVWQNGVIQRISGLGISGSIAADVNAAGLVVGTTDDLVHTTTSHRAYTWQAGTLALLDTENTFTGFTAVSNAGHIAGAIEGNPMVWINGTAHGIGPPNSLGGSAMAVNAAGHVAGEASVDSEPTKAFLWNGAAALDICPTTNSLSIAHGMNEADVVVGELDNHAFRWAGGQVTPLADLGGPSNAKAINNDEWIVGHAYPQDVFTTRAVLWRDGVCVDLNLLIPPGAGWNLVSANDVNDRGQIVGLGVIDGQVRAFRMDPVWGDLNADGFIDAMDVPPFISTLLAPQASISRRYRADLNRDGAANGADIPPFVAAVIAG